MRSKGTYTREYDTWHSCKNPMASKNVPATDGFAAWMLLIRCMSSPHTPQSVREDMSRAHVVHVMDFYMRKLDKDIEANRPQLEDNLASLLGDIVPRVSTDEELQHIREKTVVQTALQCLNSDGIPMEPFTTKTVIKGADKGYKLVQQHGDELLIK